MNLLLRLLLWPFRLLFKLALFMVGREVKRVTKEMMHAEAASTRDDGEELRRLYEKARNSQKSGVLGGTEAMGIAKKYGHWLHRHQRYEEALEVWRFAVKPSAMMHNERLECYLEFAACLLVLDRPEEAESEALRPLERLLGPKAEEWPLSDTSARIAQLRDQFLHEAKLRRKALRPKQTTPPGMQEFLTRDYDRRVKIALAYYYGGHLRYALKHIDVACSTAETSSQRVRAYTLEASWLRPFGEFQRAENRIRQALNEAGDKAQLKVRARTVLAQHLMDLGRWTELEAELEPLRQTPGEYPPTWNLLADYHMHQGRYEEAREALRQMQALSQPDPSVQRRHLGATQMAFVLLDLNESYFRDTANLNSARQNLEGAKRIFYRDAKLFAWLTGMDALLCALEGREAEAHKLAQVAETRFAEFGNDPATQETLASTLLSTYLCLKEYEPARRWGEQYLEIAKKPVYRAGVQEKLARVYEALGEESQARSLRQAVRDTGFPIMAVEKAMAAR